MLFLGTFEQPFFLDGVMGRSASAASANCALQMQSLPSTVREIPWEAI